jgi:choline dehydrogenase-like flavoprotein
LGVSHNIISTEGYAKCITGVVANNLKVYGTSNLRIADASIIPLPIATLLQATVYAIGEKVSDTKLVLCMKNSV